MIQAKTILTPNSLEGNLVESSICFDIQEPLFEQY